MHEKGKGDYGNGKYESKNKNLCLKAPKGIISINSANDWQMTIRSDNVIILMYAFL